MLPFLNLNEVFAVRPTWQRVFNFLFAPSVLVFVLVLVISKGAPLAIGIKGMAWLFFFTDQEARTDLMRISDTSTQIATWAFFSSYILMMWWSIIGMLLERENKRQSAKGHERPIEKGSGPGMLLSVQILGRIPLWEAMQLAIAIAFLNVLLGGVVMIPNALMMLALHFLGVSKSVILFLVLLECWLLSAVLVLFAYNIHCSLGDQLPAQPD